MRFILILLVLSLAGAGVYLFINHYDASPEEKGAEEFDTSDWETYRNVQFGFTIQYPPEWAVMEAPGDQIAPKFNIYKPEDVRSELPLTHHSEGTHVSIFPEGIPTEGVFGESLPSTIEFVVATENARDYVLVDGSVWATVVNLRNSPESWRESGFIFAGLLIGNHEIECYRSGEMISDEQCDPLTGDQLVHLGEVSERDRRIQVEMIKSFRYIESDDSETSDVIEHNDLIRVFEPSRNEIISSPLAISGEARGNWFFEATFSVRLTDANGMDVPLEPGFIMTEADWMTEDYVPFEATLSFTPPDTEAGTLFLERANPSGVPENADELQIPIRFADDDAAMRTVELYYYDPSLDEDSEGNVKCSADGLIAVERNIPVTLSPAEDTIQLLLRGELTAAEKAEGITTEFPLPGFELDSTNLDNGELTLRFSDPQNQTSGGSCRSSILWTQIERTGQQFETINEMSFEPKTLFQP